MNDDFVNITSLYFDKEISLYDIDKYINLTKLTLNNIIVDTNLINKIKKISKLKELVLMNCSCFDMKSLCTLNIKELLLSNTKMDDYRYINNLSNLESLIILDCDYMDLSLLSITKILNKFIVDKTEIIGTDNLFYLNNCHTLGLSNINDFDIGILLSLENLKILYLDEDTIKNNVNIIARLKQKGVSIKVVGGNYEIL